MKKLPDPHVRREVALKGKAASPWSRGPNVPGVHNQRRAKRFRMEDEKKRSPLFSADDIVPTTNKTENSG